MADPVRFVPSYDFSDFEETQPNTPKPGVQIDAQLDDISASTTSLRDAIIDIRRSDGALKNGIVTEDSLEAGLLDSLLASSGATAAAASAAAAAVSAASADTDADRAEVAADTLEDVAALLAAGGFYADWGDFHTAPGMNNDWGAWH